MKLLVVGAGAQSPRLSWDHKPFSVPTKIVKILRRRKQKGNRDISRNFKQNEVIGSCCFPAPSFFFFEQENSTQEADLLILQLCSHVWHLSGSSQGELPPGPGNRQPTQWPGHTAGTALLIARLSPPASVWKQILCWVGSTLDWQNHTGPPEQTALPFIHPSPHPRS